MNTLKVGDKVPSFTVNDHLGNLQSLEQYKGSKVVVFFYPKANTPGCTAEACDLRDHYAELTKAGYILLGVSADTEKAQKIPTATFIKRAITSGWLNKNLEIKTATYA